MIKIRLFSIFSSSLGLKFILAAILAILLVVGTLGAFLIVHENQSFSMIAEILREAMIKEGKATSDAISSIGDRSVIDVLNSLQEKGNSLARFMAITGVSPLLNNDAPTLEKYVLDAAKDKDVVYAVYVDNKGKVLTHSLPEPKDTKDLTNIVLPIDSGGSRIGAVKIGLSQKTVQQVLNAKKIVAATVAMRKKGIDITLDEVKNFIAEMTKMGIILIAYLIAIAVLVLTLVMSFIFGKIIVRPIVALNRAAQKIRAGDLGVRVKTAEAPRCWEIEKCGKQNCPAYMKADIPCWFVSNTYCHGELQGNYPEKIDGCKDCAVFEKYSGDEIQQLGITFNLMAAKLKESYEGLEEKVKEKTKELAQSLEQLEEKNKELKKLDQLKSDFLSTVSHELRSPLSIIKEGVSLILDKIAGEINEKQKKILANAKGNIDRLARLIDNLLDISKIEANKVELRREFINLTSLIKQVVANFEYMAREKSLELRQKLPEEGIKVYADPDKMVQVFTNLIVNALRFTEKGYIEVSAFQKEDEVECTVIDTGAGIPKEDLPKVFDKFQQFGRTPGPGEKGTGLGLSIAKGIIDLHKGRIWVESELGKGTRFSLVLPKYTPEALFKEYVSNATKVAAEKKSRMSLVIVSINEFDKVKQKFSDSQIQAILKDIEGVLRQSLRRQGDVALKVNNEINVVLTDCDKENALRVGSRLEQALKDYLVRQNLAEDISLSFGSATYPDEVVRDDEELINKARSSLFVIHR